MGALDDQPCVLCQRWEVGLISLYTPTNWQFTEPWKMNRVQLSDSIPNLPVCVGQLLRIHLPSHHGPLLPWNMGLDKVSPGPILVGHVDRQDFGNRYGRL
jgi:hypothetical protein